MLQWDSSQGLKCLALAFGAVGTLDVSEWPFVAMEETAALDVDVAFGRILL